VPAAALYLPPAGLRGQDENLCFNDFVFFVGGVEKKKREREKGREREREKGERDREREKRREIARKTYADSAWFWLWP
jgi:hypothetical protein